MQKTANCSSNSCVRNLSVNRGIRFQHWELRLRNQTLRVMRLICFFLFAAFISVHGKTNAQQVTLSGKNLSLKKIFSVVKEQTGYILFSKKELLQQSKLVTVDVRNILLESFLEEILRDQPLRFIIRDKTIFLYQKSTSSVDAQLSTSSIQSETLRIDITGRVIDESNNPIQGVSVMVDGTNEGTTTDSNGKFRMSVPNHTATIVFSAVGFNVLKVKVNAQTVINVTLIAQDVTMEDVVFIGYGSQKKVNLTGAVSNVNSKLLEDRPNMSVAGALQGLVPNLNINNYTGSPGVASGINIRGNTSINGGGPLILVDGIPMDVNLVNPGDIDNVSVLKDAASAAIYGARGAYGVILITTKSGKRTDKPIVSFDINYSQNSPTVFLESMNSMERMIYMNTANQYENGADYYDQYLQAAITAHFNDPSQPVVFDNPLTDPNTITYLDMAANTDWMREIQRKSYPMTQYTGSISGGTGKFNYYSSFSSLNQQGIARHFDEKYVRNNFMINLNYSILDWMTIGTKVAITNSKKKYPPSDLGYGSDQTYLNFHYALWPTYPVRLPNGGWPNYDGVSNPVQQQEEGGYRTTDIGDNWITGFVKLRPLKGMTINLNYSKNSQEQQDLDYVRNLVLYDGEGITSYYYGSIPNRVKRSRFNTAYNTLNLYAEYGKIWEEKHDFKIMVGFNQEFARYSWFNAERKQLILDGIPYMTLATGQTFANDAEAETAIRGVFSRLNYIFSERYLLELNVRYDGSSKFPKKNRFGLFPSVSAGWRIDNEKFFEGLKNTFNLLKIRASYGNLGNQDVSGVYPYISTYSAGLVNYTFGGERPMTVYSPGLVSANLTWETVEQLNFGVDFGLFQNRLTGSFDYYQRNTEKMLSASERLPSVLAVGEPNSNAADMRTIGFDLSLGWNNKIGNVRYGTMLTLSDYTAEIARFSNPSGLISGYRVGYKMGEIWGFETGGLFQSDEEAKALDQTDISNRPRIAGDLWFVDQNGDGRITRGDNTLTNPGDQKIIGNSTPRYAYGWRSNISWKGLDLVFFFQGVAKRDVRIDPSWQSFFLSQYMDEWVMYPKIGTDYWTPENRDAYFPRPLFTGDRGDISATQTRFLQNGAYIRLKQLSLSYTIPSQFMKKTFLNNFRIYATGTNLFTITKMVKSIDPELDAPQRYPISKSLTLGVKVDF